MMCVVCNYVCICWFQPVGVQVVTLCLVPSLPSAVHGVRSVSLGGQRHQAVSGECHTGRVLQQVAGVGSCLT